MLFWFNIFCQRKNRHILYNWGRENYDQGKDTAYRTDIIIFPVHHKPAAQQYKELSSNLSVLTFTVFGAVAHNNPRGVL